jgi:hypothetical protein
MTNESFTSRRQVAMAVTYTVAALLMLLIPGVPQAVAHVPENALRAIGDAWSWLGWTFSTVFSWLS